jgi:hypothetical protein
MKSPRPRNRGIFLVNMLLVIGLIGAFTMIASRLMHLALHTTYQVSQDDNDLIRLGQAMTVLRNDIWNASEIENADKSHLRTNAAQWAITPSGDLTRNAGDDHRQWQGLKIEFERQGVWLIVHHHGREIALMQQSQSGGSK